MSSARARVGAVLLAAVLLAFAVAGCAALGAAVRTAAKLQGAGYRNVGVDISSGAGQAAGGVVRVSYSSGPAGANGRDAEHAERIVWDTLRYRFGVLVVVKVAGGCAGPVCVSGSRVLARATYAQLAARFGPRPRGLSAPGGTGFPVWVIALVAGVAVAIGAAVAVILVLALRPSRRSPGRRGPPPYPQ